MEGVQRMPMLSVETKLCTTSTDFGPKLLGYISNHYEEDPASFTEEVSELNKLRESAIKAPSDISGCSTLKKYYAQLHLLKTRFPMDQKEEAAVAFTWHDKYFDMPSPLTYEELNFELCCILHNVGAVHSYLGAVDNRTSAEGMKISCTHFQCAAWAFQHLRDGFACEKYSTDFDRNLLTWCSALMLAQAQECILEKSLVDNRKPSIIAKVAVQVVEFYKQCSKAVEHSSVEEIVGTSKVKSWSRMSELKQHYYQAVAYYQMGLQAEMDQQWGQRLTYCEAAEKKLSEAVKMGKKDSEIVQSALQFANDVIGGKYQIAKKENDFVYHEKVPALDTLPEVKGASLVKGISFDPVDPEVSGPDIFAKLVPLSVHQYASMYSEEKAKILRDAVGRIEEKDDELSQFLSSMEFESLTIGSEENKMALPQVLLERCAKLGAQPRFLHDIQTSLEKLAENHERVTETLKSLESLVDAENVALKDFENSHGKHPGILSKIPEDLLAELARYLEADRQASNSNDELAKALASHREHIVTLTKTLPELEMALPRPSVLGKDTPEGEELKRIVDKIEEMQTQRRTLLESLRGEVQKDEITKMLLSMDREKEPSNIFSRELKKHDKTIGLIDQNLKAQENILRALTEANAKYVDIRKAIDDSCKKRDSFITVLVQSHDTVTDIREKAASGLEFYQKLLDAVNKFDKRIRKLCSELEEMRTKIKADIEKKAAAQQAPVVPTLPSNPVSTVESKMAPVNSDGTPGVIAPSTLPADSGDGGGGGPKLKDYMAYYRAKKAGLAVEPPGTEPVRPNPSAGLPFPAPEFNPSSTNSSVPTISGYPASSGGHGSAPHIPQQHISSNPQLAASVSVGGYNSVSGDFPNPNYGMGGAGSFNPNLCPQYPTGGSSNRGQQFHNPASSGTFGGQQGMGQNISNQSSVCPPINNYVQGQQFAGGGASASHNIMQNQVPVYQGFAGGANHDRGNFPRQNVPTMVSQQQALAYPTANGPPWAVSIGQPQYRPFSGANQIHSQGMLGNQVNQSQPYTQNSQWHPQSQNIVQQPQNPLQHPQYPSHHPQSSLRQPQYSSQQPQNFLQQSQPQYPSQHPQNPLQQPQYNSQNPQNPIQQPPYLSQHPQNPLQQPQYNSQNPHNPIQQPQTPSQHPQKLVNMPPGSTNLTSSAVGVSQSGMSNISTSGQTYQHQFGATTLSAGNDAPFTDQQQRWAASVGSYPPGPRNNPQLSMTHTAAAAQSFAQQPAMTHPSRVLYQQPELTHSGQFAAQPSNVTNPGQMVNQVTHSGQPQMMAQSGQQSLKTHPQSQQSSMTYPQPTMTHTGQIPGQHSMITHPGQTFVQPPPVVTHPGQLASITHPGQISAQPSSMTHPGQVFSPAAAVNTNSELTSFQQSATSHPGQISQQHQAVVYNHQHPGQQQTSTIGPMTQMSMVHVVGSDPQAQQSMSNFPSQPTDTSNPTLPSSIGQLGSNQQGSQNIANSLAPTVSNDNYSRTVGTGGGGFLQNAMMATSQLKFGVPTTAASESASRPSTTAYSSNAPNIGYYSDGVPVASSSFSSIYGYAQTGTVLTAVMSSGASAGSQNYTDFRYPSASGAETSAKLGAPSATKGAVSGGDSTASIDSLRHPVQSLRQFPQNSSTSQVLNNSGSYEVQQHTAGGALSNGQVVQQQIDGNISNHGDFKSILSYFPNNNNNWGLASATPPVFVDGGHQQHSAGVVAPTDAIRAPVQFPKMDPPPTNQKQQLATIDQSPPDGGRDLPPPLEPKRKSVAGGEKDTASDGSAIITSSARTTNGSDVPSGLKSGGTARIPSISASNGEPAAAEDGDVPHPHFPSAFTTPTYSNTSPFTKPAIARRASVDPFSHADTLQHFAAEVEKFEKFVSGLNRKSLNGPTPLETKWKEMSDAQDKQSRCHSISAARCCSSKNRFPEVMPYDDTRVKLKYCKDDYINASLVTNLSKWSCSFVATQTPLPGTVGDFWLMVSEQQLEVVGVLATENEIRAVPFWPTDRKLPLVCPGVKLSIVLQSESGKSSWTELTLTVTHLETKAARTVILLHFKDWPKGAVPSHPRSFLGFVDEVCNHYKAQRNQAKPVCICCSSGVGATGVFILVAACTMEIRSGGSLPHIPNLVELMRSCRKYLICEQKELLFAYEAVLYFAQNLLMSNGILSSSSKFSDSISPAPSQTHNRHPSQDFIFGSKPMSIQAVQSLVDSSSPPRNVGQSQLTSGHSKELSVNDAVETGMSNEAKEKSNSKYAKILTESKSVDSSPRHNIVSNGCGSGNISRDLQQPITNVALEQRRTSLVDLVNPDKFDLGTPTDTGSAMHKRRITKDDFLKSSSEGPSSIKPISSDPADPFGAIDPMWSMKGLK